MDKNKFISLDKQAKDEALGRIAIEFCNKNLLVILPVTTFWNSTLEKLYRVTDNIYYGGKAKKIVNRYNLLLFVILVYIPFFSPLTFWYALISVIASIFIVNKLRSYSLRKCIIETATDNPYGFKDMWDYKLMGLMAKSTLGDYEYGTHLYENRWQDIVLAMLGWDDLMEKEIKTTKESLDELKNSFEK